MSFGRFLGVGVSDSGDAVAGHLDRAVPDVRALMGALGDVFESEILRNPAESTIRRRLKKLPNSIPGGPLVVLWCGHAVGSDADSLRLLARDSSPGAAAGVGISDLVAPCAESGANQLLFLVDTCFSGAAVSAGDVAARIMRSRPPEGGYVWVGVLTSCLDVETARDGLFGHRLREALANGPRTPELRVRWSPHSQYVRGDDVCDTVLKEWDSDLQSPDFSSRGSAWWVFPNPLYDPGAPEQVVEHLLQAARGGTRLDQRSWFTGRTMEVNQVVDWVHRRRPGTYVITGSAGTGKSAIVGRVVSLSNPQERECLLGDGLRWEHQDPGEGSVHAHLHARGLTADRAAAMIADQLVGTKVLEPQLEPRNASELVGQLQRSVEQGGAPPVVVVDGLDEARDEAFSIADELLTRLARYAVIIVSTRELRRDDDRPSLIGALAPEGPRLDLDDQAVQDCTRTDVAAYITARLGKRDPRMDAHAVAEYLTSEASMTAGRPFLLARLVTDQLRASPVDTSLKNWTDRVSHSVEEAFDRDLAAVGPPPHRQIERRTTAVLARSLLSALTWGYGGGFPEEEWLATASAIAPETSFSRDDLQWVLNELGRYIVQDGEAGVAVYRPAHQTLADYLRYPYQPQHDEPFDRQALPIVEALAARYRSLLRGGVPVEAPGYLWRYFWRHVAAAGPEGLTALRSLAITERDLLGEVAMAAAQIVETLKYWGQRQQALTLAEEVTQIRRDLAKDHHFDLPFLAGALVDLAICYSEVGRLSDAVPPAEEAVSILRDAARESPEWLPILALAVGNLGKHYSEVGRRSDALTLTEEATALQRDLARGDPALIPQLAAALTNLGIHYSETGRLEEAISPAEEAVEIVRNEAREDPELQDMLATTLNNLGNRYGQVGRYQDALAAAQEAVQLRRALAADNPALLPALAKALNNLGTSYDKIGRSRQALDLIEEAVRLRRDLAASDLAFLPDLAQALNSLGSHYSDSGRVEEAVPVAEEAVQLLHALAADNCAFVPDLAMALTNLGKNYMQAGRIRDAVTAAEEAVRIVGELADDNPAFLHRFAHDLSNLSAYYIALKRFPQAESAAERSVHIYDELVVTNNPAILTGMAEALNNLGVCRIQAGRVEEALVFFERSAHINKGLARDNPAHLHAFARALGNIASLYMQNGRVNQGVAAAEQAVRIYRALARENTIFLAEFSWALSSLASIYIQSGRREDAIPLLEEAVRVSREPPGDLPPHLPGLAAALSELGSEYGALGRVQDGLAATKEAVRLYRDLARDSTSALSHLAEALNNLSTHYSALDTPEETEAAWVDVLAAIPAASQAFLLTARAAAADAGDPDAVLWLTSALNAGPSHQRVVAQIHNEARRHRASDPPTFDAAWRRCSDHPVPKWLTIDTHLIATAKAWLGTETLDQERDFLANHPDLLDPAADDAVRETLLPLGEAAGRWYAKLRQQARTEGVEAAYRPVLLRMLAQQFTDADPDTQRILLTRRREDLLSATVLDTIKSLAEEDAMRAHRAGALLALAMLREHDPVLDALAESARFSPLLHELAGRPDLTALAPAAAAALTVATTAEQAATALYYAAVAAAAAGNAARASEMLAQARRLDPGQVAAWISGLADIGQRHPAVLPLITTLTQPLADPENSEPADPAGDDPKTGDDTH